MEYGSAIEYSVFVVPFAGRVRLATVAEGKHIFSRSAARGSAGKHPHLPMAEGPRDGEMPYFLSCSVRSRHAPAGSLRSLMGPIFVRFNRSTG